MTAALTTEPTEKSCRPRGHDWEQAGAAWGHEADDWACLFVPAPRRPTSTCFTIAWEPTP